MKFGELIKNLRIAKQLTLRQCSAALGVDPSNWSKMERGVTPPPKDLDILERWAEAFGLSGEHKQEFFDAAAVSRHEIPGDLVADEKLLEKLPAFFRAVRGAEFEGEKFDQLISDLRAIHSPDKQAAK